METKLALISSNGQQTSGTDQGVLAHRIFLHANELYRVPATYRQVRTSRGIAHISHGGKDFVLQAGESTTLARTADVALISPLHSETLVLELFV